MVVVETANPAEAQLRDLMARHRDNEAQLDELASGRSIDCSGVRPSDVLPRDRDSSYRG